MLSLISLSCCTCGASSEPNVAVAIKHPPPSAFLASICDCKSAICVSKLSISSMFPNSVCSSVSCDCKSAICVSKLSISSIGSFVDVSFDRISKDSMVSSNLGS